MGPRRVGLLLGGALLTLTGCTGLVRELKEDPAIVGFTGYFLKAGITLSTGPIPFPLPSLEAGYGTGWRVGIHDCVYLSTSSGSNVSVAGQTTQVIPGADAGGQGRLTISATGLDALRERWQAKSSGALTLPPTASVAACIPYAPQYQDAARKGAETMPVIPAAPPTPPGFQPPRP